MQSEEAINIYIPIFVFANKEILFIQKTIFVKKYLGLFAVIW